MPIVAPDPTPEPWCTLDGEAMPYAEWERRIGEPEARCSPDGVLAAIDACLDDCAVSGDAMRWAPDEPDPTPETTEGGRALWGRYINGDTVYRTTEPPYRFEVVPGEPPTIRGATPSAVFADEGMTTYVAIATPEGEQFVQDETHVWTGSSLPQSQTLTIVLACDTTEFTRAWLNTLLRTGKTLDDLLADQYRRRRFKSEYHRRRRNRR